MSTREYDNGRHDPPSNSMNLRKLYIGGIPNHVVAPHLTNRYVEVTDSDVIERGEENKGQSLCLEAGLEVSKHVIKWLSVNTEYNMFSTCLT